MTIAFPHPPGHGGPGSFQERFEKAFLEEGYKVIYADDKQTPDIIFVVGGTKRLLWLWKMKINGVPIIHRLDGLAWLHRKNGIQSFILGEKGNFVFKFIHSFLADYVVYQSQFVKQWWDKSGWSKTKGSSVIYNGVDTQLFKPISNSVNPKSLLCVEGTLDYSPYAIDLLNTLQIELIEKSSYKSLILYGGFQDVKNRYKLLPAIDYRGKVARSELPSIYKDAVYLSLDVNAACPNTVIEALSCGLPVIGFDTGALKELIHNAGEIVSFGGNPWELKNPSPESLILAARRVLDSWEDKSKIARQLSQRFYTLERMFISYRNIVNKVSN